MGNDIIVNITDPAPIAISITDNPISFSLDAGVSIHDLLSGLQGGLTAEYYHLSAAQHGALGAVPAHNDLSSIQGGQVGQYYHMTAADYAARILGSGTLGYIPYFTGAQGIGNSNIFYDAVNGRVGIGITAPTAQLHLVKANSSALTDFLINPTVKTSGNLIDAQVGSVSKFKVDNTGIVYASNYFSSPLFIATAGIQSNLIIPYSSANLLLGPRSNAYSIVLSSNQSASGEIARADGPSANFSVGTTTPTAKFQVAQQTWGPGTVSVSGTAVTGVGTQFTNTFKVGDTITVTTTSGAETKAITAVTSDTVLATDAFAGTAAAGTAYTLVGGSRFKVSGNGRINVGTISDLADNAAAVTAGLAVGDFYKTGDNLKIVHA